MVDTEASAGAEAVRLSPNQRNADAFRSKPSRLWLWFVAAFVVQAAVWAIWFTIAAHHQVQTVPLVQTR